MLAARETETKKDTIVRASFKAMRVVPAGQRDGSELNLHPLYLYLQYLSQTLNGPNPEFIEINSKISESQRSSAANLTHRS